MGVNGKITYLNGKQPKYINGAFGGINGKGEFIANFFYESPELPEIFILDENKREQFSKEPLGVEKFVQCSLCMSLETAKSIMEWMKSNIELMENGSK